MTDKQNFEKDINVPSKRLDRIDKMEIDLANYEQMERDIEKIIEPYQLDWELDCLSLPSAIQSILERKEQECEELKRQLKVKENILKLTDEAKNEYSKENNKLKQTLAEIKEIIHFNKTNRLSGGACISIEQILQKISECEGNDELHSSLL